jgi:cytochrome c oxidase subunit 3
MNLAMLFFAVLAVIAAWWLSQQRIAAKPWLETGAAADTGASPLPPAKIGLGVFLAVAGTLFALFFSAYFMRMSLPQLNASGWQTLDPPKLLWLNTAFLALSSAALQWAHIGAYRRQIERMRRGLLLAGGLAFAFLAGQLIAWRELSAAGYYLTASPAAAFFYLITGVHGLHLLGGLVALGATSDRAWRSAAAADAGLSVELCAIYWHFLLLVWLVFFVLLLVTAGAPLSGGLFSLICSVF